MKELDWQVPMETVMFLIGRLPSNKFIRSENKKKSI